MAPKYFFHGILQRNYSKTSLKRPPQKRQTKAKKTNYHLMQVKSIAECSKEEHSAILFLLKWPYALNARSSYVSEDYNVNFV